MSSRQAYLGDTRRPADFPAWLKADTWSVPETAALLLGVQPNWSDWPMKSDEHEPVQTQYRQLLSYVHRAIAAGALKEPITPSAAVDWARSKDFPIPSELLTVAAGPRELGSRERQSIMKITLGMAKAKYGFDPDAAASPAHQAIARDLQQQGHAVDVDTIRKWLKKAADEVDKG